MNFAYILVLFYLNVASGDIGLSKTESLNESHYGQSSALIGEIHPRIKRADSSQSSNFQMYSGLFKAGMSIGANIHQIELVPTDNNVLDAAKLILDEVAGISGQFGLIVKGLGAILLWSKRSTPTDRQIMLAEFSKVNARFDAIYSELNDIKVLISNTPFRTLLMEQTENIKTLVTKFEYYQSLKFLQDDFTYACQRYDAGAALDFLYRNRDGLISIFADSYDRLQTLNAMREMFIIFTNGIKMVEACQANKFKYNDRGNEFYAEFENKVNDVMTIYIKNYTDKMKSVMQMFYDADSNIYRNFWPNKAKSEINDFVNRHPTDRLDHKAFSNELFAFLSNKYYWRKFIVGSYSDQARGFDQHYYSTTAATYYKFRDPTGRSWFVALAALPSKNSNLKSAVHSCVYRNTGAEDKLEGNACEAIRGQDVERCIETELGNRASIICVKHRNGIRYHYHITDDIYFEDWQTTHLIANGMYNTHVDSTITLVVT